MGAHWAPPNPPGPHGAPRVFLAAGTGPGGLGGPNGPHGPPFLSKIHKFIKKMYEIPIKSKNVKNRSKTLKILLKKRKTEI